MLILVNNISITFMRLIIFLRSREISLLFSIYTQKIYIERPPDWVFLNYFMYVCLSGYIIFYSQYIYIRVSSVSQFPFYIICVMCICLFYLNMLHLSCKYFLYPDS